MLTLQAPYNRSVPCCLGEFAMLQWHLSATKSRQLLCVFLHGTVRYQTDLVTAQVAHLDGEQTRGPGFASQVLGDARVGSRVLGVNLVDLQRRVVRVHDDLCNTTNVVIIRR